MKLPHPIQLQDLLLVADAIGRVHGTPPEAVLLHALAMGSALAGDLVTSKPGGVLVVPAKFSLLIRTPDPEPPWWIAEEWKHLKERQDQVLNARANTRYAEVPIAKLRRRQRLLRILNNGSGFDAAMIDRHIECAKNQKAFRFLHRIGDGRPAAIPDCRSITLVAGGFRELGKILRSRNHPDSYWAMLKGGQVARSNLLAWIAAGDWRALVSESGKPDLPALGLIVACPATSYHPDSQVTSRLVAATMLHRLEMARFGSTRYAYTPGATARNLLDSQTEQARELANTLPPGDQNHVLPDPHLGWHLSAILAALCADGGVQEHQIVQATSLGTALASWAVRQHVHHYHHAFPADDQGPFTGQDLSVLRFLTPAPAPVRAFQRRLRGVTRDSCLRSLRRVVDAGLAIEPEPGHFAAVPTPVGPGLSEFHPLPEPADGLTPGSGPHFPDITDNRAL